MIPKSLSQPVSPKTIYQKILGKYFALQKFLKIWKKLRETSAMESEINGVHDIKQLFS